MPVAPMTVDPANVKKAELGPKRNPQPKTEVAFGELKEAEAWTTFNTKSMLGGSVLGQKKYAEAEPLLLAGYDGMKQREEKIPAVGKARLTEAVERLVHLYDATEQKEKVAEWRKKLEAPREADKKAEKPKEK